MDFRILGPLEVTAADRPLPVASARQRALFVVLGDRADDRGVDQVALDARAVGVDDHQRQPGPDPRPDHRRTVG